MLNPSLLREGDWIEQSPSGNYIIRSVFYSVPRSIDEIIEHTFRNINQDTILPIIELGLPD